MCLVFRTALLIERCISCKSVVSSVMEIDVTPDVGLENASSEETDGRSSRRSSSTSSKKIIKHALRQQAKRRRKNTAVTATTTNTNNNNNNNNNTVPRIIVKPLPPQPPAEDTRPQKIPTMREVLASIPGFNMKPRKRSNKKLSTAAQLEQTKEGCIDLETPDSILVNTNLRALLNKYTFASLPPLYQNKLVQLLPSVDRQIITNPSDSSIKLSASGLNNEFFARACLEWQERLAEGEFTPENQQKLKTEADKERSRVDPWKLKHFEPIWGDRSTSDSAAQARPPIKTTIKLRPSTTVNSNKNKPAPLIKRLRTVGAMTRSCTSYLSSTTENKPKSPIPDLLPIKSLRSHAHKIEHTRTNSPLTRSSTPSTEKQQPSEIVPDISIINISDTVLKTDEETIISVENNRTNKLAEKRQRSPSLETEQRPQKRKSPSPLPELEDAKVSKLEEFSAKEEEVSTESSEATKETHHSIDEDQRSQDSISSQDSFDKMQIVEEEEEEEEDDDEEEEEDETPQEEEEEESEDEQQTVFSNEIEPPIEHEDTSSDLESEHIHHTYISEPTDPDVPSTVTLEELELPQCRIEDKLRDPPPLLPSQHYSKLEDFHYQETDHYQESESQEYIEQDAHDYQESDSQDYQEQKSIVETVQTEIQTDPEAFEILPNTLILQQDSLVLEKTVCSENCPGDICLEASAEKLEASVEESDLVMSQLSQTNFDDVRTITGEDEVNEDPFIDAENYVLESGQLNVAEPEKLINKTTAEAEIQATLFGTSAVNTGNFVNLFDLLFYCIVLH